MYTPVNIPAIEKNHLVLIPLKIPMVNLWYFHKTTIRSETVCLGTDSPRSLSFEALKLVAATVLLAPQVPLLFMGEEYGEKNPFQYFISHTDAQLVKMVQEGRKKEFSYFKWQGDVPDPQNEEKF